LFRRESKWVGEIEIERHETSPFDPADSDNFGVDCTSETLHTDCGDIMSGIEEKLFAAFTEIFIDFICITSHFNLHISLPGHFRTVGDACANVDFLKARVIFQYLASCPATGEEIKDQ
jgi:hypothetical protein